MSARGRQTYNDPELLALMETLTLPDLRAVPLDRLDGTRLLGLRPEGTRGEEVAPVVSVRAGLPVAAFDRLQAFLDEPAAALAAALGLAPRTLNRRRQSGRLSADESDRLLRTARLAELALVALEDADAAARWLTSPKRLLAGETPLERADTAPGAREVEDMLFAIEFSLPA
jgi:putative toxin-antitoxin system antitoxin component (TIGR02293 family)